jgi:hypothetical protein
VVNVIKVWHTINRFITTGNCRIKVKVSNGNKRRDRDNEAGSFKMSLAQIEQ